jgi:hypothetical protein
MGNLCALIKYLMDSGEEVQYDDPSAQESCLVGSCR